MRKALTEGANKHDRIEAELEWESILFEGEFFFILQCIFRS